MAPGKRFGWVQVVVMMVVTAVVTSVATVAVASHTFTDVSTSNVHHGNISWLAATGITKGCNPPANDRFCPGQAVTREQMATFMNRLATSSGAIEAGGLGDGSVVRAKIANGAINGAKVANGAVTRPKIADGAINRDKMAPLPAWREIGTAGNPGFQNGFANFGGGYSTAAFLQDHAGVVHLKGFVLGPTNSIAFTLPAGLRPAQHLAMAVPSSGPVAAAVEIRTEGTIRFYCDGGGPCNYSLDGLTFIPAP
jgi:hypothetical protein